MDKSASLQVTAQFRSLNYKILRRIEIEMDTLKENYPELEQNFDNIYKRLRSGILDDIGDMTRCLKRELFENHV